nr:hypothetical protein [Candidatus Baldrarchaeota archaeon]
MSILIVAVIDALTVMIYNLPLKSGDMRRHYGLALQYLEGFPVYGGRLLPSYPYLFHIYLAVLFSICGIPSALAEQGMYILTFMPILAFYSAVKVWFNREEDRDIPSVAIFLSILLGFGGLYAIYLRLSGPDYDILKLLQVTTSKTYDIYMRFLYLPDIVAPIWIIGLPAFFALLYFLGKESFKPVEAIIVSILVTLGYLGHITEIFLFTFVFFVYTLFIRHSNEKRMAPYVLSGLVIVVLVDLAAPAQLYVVNRASLSFFASVFLSLLAGIMEFIEDKCFFNFSPRFKDSLIKKLELKWGYIRWVLLYVYIFSFIVWFTLEKDFNLWEWGGYNFTPFFVYPLRFGAVGLLATLCIFFYFTKLIQDRHLLFFLLLIPIGFTLEQIANYYPLYPAYRFATLTFVGSSVVAAYGVTKALNASSIVTSHLTKRKIIICVLLTFIVIFGMLSTILYYVYASNSSRYNKISKDELDALNYIRKHISTNVSVLTFTKTSADRLREFAAVNPVQDAQRWSKLLLSTSNPYIMTYVLASSNIKYIYVAQRDIGLLNSNDVLRSFIRYFPKVFENDYVTVFEVPSLTPPSSEGGLGVLHFSPFIQRQEATMWTDDTFTKGWCPYLQHGEVKSFELKVKDGIAEISVTSNQPGTVWASYALSGLTLNTTIFSSFSFKYRVENNLTWFTIRLWNSSGKVFFYIGHLTDREFTTKIFLLPENQTITRIEIIVETTKNAPANTTARAYIDYIKFSSLVFYWRDDDFSRDWAFYGKYGNVYNWNAHSNGDILEISVTSNQSGTVWVSYSLPLMLKTKNSILSFRYKVDNDYTWFTIILQNATDRFFFYIGHLTDREFTTKIFLLPENQTITRIEIIVETTKNAPANTTARAYIDYIEISPSPFSTDDVFPSLFVSLLRLKYSVLYVDSLLLEDLDAYLSRYTHILLTSDPSIPIESLLNWISEGNTLIIFNTRGNGFFANLLGIKSSSSLLSIKDFGLGKVIYINSFTTIKAGKETELLRPDFLNKVKEALTLEEYKPKVNVLPVYNSTFGSIKIKGDLSIFTDILMLQGSVNLTSSPFPLNKSREIKIYGKVNLTIRNATLLIFPSESYMIIKPESYPVEGGVLVDDSNALIVMDANVTYQSDMPVSFKFKTAAISFFARLPSITASGTITFDQLDVHAALYIPLAGIVQQKAEIQGNVKFDTMYVSGPLTIFSRFQVDGRVLNLEAKPRPSIPWAKVLSSPYNIGFNILFFSCIAIYIAKRENQNRMNEEL